MRDLQIVNIKLSLKIDCISFEDVIEQTSHLQNNRKLRFIVIFQTHTYTVFKPNASTGQLHCNVTKVKSMSDISLAVEEFFAIFSNADLKGIAMDNITENVIGTPLIFSFLRYDPRRIPPTAAAAVIATTHRKLFNGLC